VKLSEEAEMSSMNELYPSDLLLIPGHTIIYQFLDLKKLFTREIIDTDYIDEQIGFVVSVYNIRPLEDYLYVILPESVGWIYDDMYDPEKIVDWSRSL
jgi:hypothetical protein